MRSPLVLNMSVWGNYDGKFSELTVVLNVRTPSQEFCTRTFAFYMLKKDETTNFMFISGACCLQGL
jgi:hypothetical protein